MFVNNNTGQRGLVCQYDVVCFDEVSGAVLYELLAGQPVFQSDPREAIHKILSVDPPALSTQAKGVHPDLETVCHKRLEKVPKDRYETGAQFCLLL
jgi:hypothetical protein